MAFVKRPSKPGPQASGPKPQPKNRFPKKPPSKRQRALMPSIVRSWIADALVIATGRSSRHVAAIAEHLARRLKDAGYGTRPINGAQQGDWVLVDAGEVIVHVFRSEVRDYYD